MKQIALPSVIILHFLLSSATFAADLPSGSAVTAERNMNQGEADKFCQSDDIRAHFDDRDGEFTGMSQRGVLLVMENISDHTCQLVQRPKIIFSGKTDKGIIVQATQRISRTMHPGPVLLPVILEPGHKHSVTVRWVSGDVYDDSHNCITTSGAIVNLAGQPLHISAQFQMCAPKGHTDFFTTG